MCVVYGNRIYCVLYAHTRTQLTCDDLRTRCDADRASRAKRPRKHTHVHVCAVCCCCCVRWCGALWVDVTATTELRAFLWCVCVRTLHLPAARVVRKRMCAHYSRRRAATSQHSTQSQRASKKDPAECTSRTPYASACSHMHVQFIFITLHPFKWMHALLPERYMLRARLWCVAHTQRGVQSGGQHFRAWYCEIEIFSISVSIIQALLFTCYSVPI